MPAGSLSRRILGKTALNVSWPALGGAGIGATETFNSYGVMKDEDAIDAIRAAAEGGINFIDTSPLYGDSERRIGLAKRVLGDEIRDVHIQTKCGTHPSLGGYDRDSIMRSIENSLNVMEIDFIDCLLMHDPSQDDLDVAFATNGGLEAMLDAKRQGMCKHIGVGVREHDVLARFMNTGECDVVLSYLDYNLMNRSAEREIFPLAVELGVGIVNGGVFYNGLIAGEDPNVKIRQGNRPASLAKQKPVDLATEMWTWCEERNVSLGTLALHWGLHETDPFMKNGTCVIGARNAEEVRGILDLMCGKRSPEDVEMRGEEIEEILASFRMRFDEQVEAFDDHFYYDATAGPAG